MQSPQTGKATNPPNIAPKPSGATVIAWRAYEKNTLRGFFSIQLPSGMVIHELTFHQKNDKEWVGLPAREWKDSNGDKKWTCLIEFTSRPAADKFRDLAVAAVHDYLDGEGGR